jgi:hypothetical protein
VKSDKTDVKRVVLFARWVSWIGHPLVFISLTVGIIIALRLANRAGLGSWLVFSLPRSVARDYSPAITVYRSFLRTALVSPMVPVCSTGSMSRDDRPDH